MKVAPYGQEHESDSPAYRWQLPTKVKITVGEISRHSAEVTDEGFSWP
jgi:hypothetical protein